LSGVDENLSRAGIHHFCAVLNTTNVHKRTSVRRIDVTIIGRWAGNEDRMAIVALGPTLVVPEYVLAPVAKKGRVKILMQVLLLRRGDIHGTSLYISR
jgi:hypothetical protein